MRRMELHPGDANEASIRLPGSPFQRLIHNKLIERLEALRTELEVCSPEDLKTKQGNIAELKRMLGFLHERDGASLKETYA